LPNIASDRSSPYDYVQGFAGSGNWPGMTLWLLNYLYGV
jgi:hypothetical protein